MEDKVLIVRNLAKHYDNNAKAGDKLSVLKNISLSLQKGEMLGVVGASGSGKSTLFRLIAGLDRPDQGDIIVDRRTLQMVSQDPRESFSPRMTMKDFFLSVFDTPKNGNSQNRATLIEEIIAMLAEVELTPIVLEALAHQLSGGELQRIIIARALLLKPAVILFDEPTSALDVLTQSRIVRLIAKLRHRHGFAGIFVSHDIAAVQASVDRVVILHQGEFIEELPAKDILQAKEPQTKSLIKAQLFQ